MRKVENVQSLSRYFRKYIFKAEPTIAISIENTQLISFGREGSLITWDGFKWLRHHYHATFSSNKLPFSIVSLYVWSQILWITLFVVNVHETTTQIFRFNCTYNRELVSYCNPLETTYQLASKYNAKHWRKKKQTMTTKDRLYSDEECLASLPAVPVIVCLHAPKWLDFRHKITLTRNRECVGVVIGMYCDYGVSMRVEKSHNIRLKWTEIDWNIRFEYSMEALHF